MVYSDEGWKPTTIKRAGLSEDTSTGVTQVLTDCGWAYCKPLGNRQGEQVLASEWVCLRLARWLGLPTFRAAIINLDADATFPLPDHDGRKYHAQAGPCFITESTPGRKWDRTSEDLDRLVNPDDIAKLVVFDTWVLNRDRHYPDYAALGLLRTVAATDVDPIIAEVPTEWHVDEAARRAWLNLILSRAQYLCASFPGLVQAALG